MTDISILCGGVRANHSIFWVWKGFGQTIHFCRLGCDNRPHNIEVGWDKGKTIPYGELGLKNDSLVIA